MCWKKNRDIAAEPRQEMSRLTGSNTTLLDWTIQTPGWWEMYKERERERKNKQSGWLETPKVPNTFASQLCINNL